MLRVVPALLFAVGFGQVMASSPEGLAVRVQTDAVEGDVPQQGGSLAVVLDQVKEGFAEDLQASLVELIAGSLGKQLTLSVVGNPSFQDGRSWLSDPMHAMLNRFKPYAGSLDFAIQGYEDDAKEEWWKKGYGSLSNISQILMKTGNKIQQVFGSHPTTYMPPLGLEDALNSNLTAQDYFIIPALSTSTTRAGGCADDSHMHPIIVRTNNNQSNQCGFSQNHLEDLRRKLRNQMTACKGTAVLVLSPFDIADRAPLSGTTCGGKLPRLMGDLSDFFKSLEQEDGYKFVRMCDLSGKQCPTGNFPLWPFSWRAVAVWGTYGLGAISIMLSVLSSLANWAILGSCLRWAARLPESGRRQTCALVLTLVGAVVLFTYLLTYFVFSFLPMGTQLFIWKPLDIVGTSRDTLFSFFVAVFCLPLFMMLCCSLRSLKRWQQWSREGDRFNQLLSGDRQCDAFEPQPPRAMVVVPVYQEDWRAFMRMVSSATHSEYADKEGKLFEVLIVFDGLEKDNARLERTCHCRDALWNYLPTESRRQRDVRLRGATVPYISGVDPDTGVRIHAIMPAWGGKWSAQRYAWYMLQELKQDGALLLCIDSDCAVKPDSLKKLARCMHEKSDLQAVAGHIKVDMRKRFNWLWKVQECDFLISQMIVRGCEDQLGAVSCLPGAFCMIRWQAFDQVQQEYFYPDVSDNPWDVRRVHIAEDRYLTYLILKTFGKGAVAYCTVAEASTECPDQMQMLATQRKRWYLSAIVNDIPMCLSKEMWRKYPEMMSLHAWTLVMTSVPANALQVALLAEAGMCFRHREPDLTLLIITVVPLYLLVMYYCLVAQRRGPMIYYWVFMLFMPLFNMCMGIYAYLKPVSQFHRPDAGRDGQTAGHTGQVAAGTGEQGQTAAGAAEDPEAPTHESLVFNCNRAQMTQSWPQTESWREGLAALHVPAPPDNITRDSFRPICLTDVNWNFQHDDEHRLRENTRLKGINFFRYLAAVHIVLFHYYKTYRDNPFGFIEPDQQQWISWGGQWVQFFFMLSGFVMTYSRLCRPDGVENWYSVWFRQMSAVYPTYFLSIFMGFTLMDNGLKNLFKRTLPATLLLIFNWYPQMECFEMVDHKPAENPSWHAWFCVEGINQPAWFLGALQVYWLLYPQMYKLVRRLSQPLVVLLLLISWSLCLFWPLVLTIIPTPDDQSWVRALQEFHPVSHLHKFLFGMCVARLFVDLFCEEDPMNGRRGKFVSQAKVDRNVELRLFAPIALVVIITLMFFSGPLNKFMFLRLSSYEFVLLPAFALLVVGLGFETSWISRLLLYRPFSWAESLDMSFEIYIMQGWTFNWCTSLFFLTGNSQEWETNGKRIVYPFVLLAVSFFTNHYLSTRRAAKR
jgi:cellulose synthase/poly-beta-1,6-N-acetylglucosamine synthase-like glycosyltransferase/peptidoglycan/LPS O-acetylase OafA/YrhL